MKFLVLRRDFLGTVTSHIRWSGSAIGHATMVGAHVTLISAMLSALPRDAWRSIEPHRISSDHWRPLTDALLRWLDWPEPSEADQREALRDFFHDDWKVCFLLSTCSLLL